MPSGPRIVLTSPGPEQVLIPGLTAVRGYVAGGASDVLLVIRDDRDHVLDAVRESTVLELAGDHHLPERFVAHLRVPNPPLRGRIWLELIAYDADGQPVATTARSLRIVDAALLPPSDGIRLGSDEAGTVVGPGVTGGGRGDGHPGHGLRAAPTLNPRAADAAPGGADGASRESPRPSS